MRYPYIGALNQCADKSNSLKTERAYNIVSPYFFKEECDMISKIINFIKGLISNLFMPEIRNEISVSESDMRIIDSTIRNYFMNSEFIINRLKRFNYSPVSAFGGYFKNNYYVILEMKENERVACDILVEKCLIYLSHKRPDIISRYNVEIGRPDEGCIYFRRKE